ncbi:Pvc16 family protein [Streptomyces sp. NPDC057910]|uniref:Pvc16 family protein n=1 Tax=Streptomyces sp. NPDC057910 TaxID=3346278 RepID=UPI0036E1DB7C
MLQTSSSALLRHLATVLADSCDVTAEPPLTSLTEAPELDGGPNGIGVHLFHVAAADQGQGTASVEVRDAQGRVVSRRSPACRYRTRWLVWSWGPTAAERLTLLDEALRLLSARSVLPIEATGPELAAGGLVHLETAPAAGTAAELAGIFTSLGVPARPALEVVLTTGLAPVDEPAFAPPVDVRVVTAPQTKMPVGSSSQ